MIVLRPLLMITAFLCLVLSAFGIAAPRGNLQSLGLALWLLAVIIQ